MLNKPIGILYEHPEWFAPLFAELDRRGLDYARIPAHELRYDPDERAAPYRLLVNRVSPSAYLRDHAGAIFNTGPYLAYLEELGVPVLNGARVHALEISKARQLALLARLGLPHPRSLVVNHTSQIAPAAAALTFPLIVKPNIGGSGALMRRFDTPAELDVALAAHELDGVFGLDCTAIVQEYHPPRGGSIVRVEALAGRFLYAIRIANQGQDFNLCPADICQAPDAAPAGTSGTGDFEFCPVEAPAKKPLRIEATTPPDWAVEAVLQLFGEAGIEIGGVEYLESERDGRLYFYDINSLSNFVTDAPTLVGFDPFARFVDYIERRAGLGAPALALGR